jgi:hypothetical protein
VKAPKGREENRQHQCEGAKRTRSGKIRGKPQIRKRAGLRYTKPTARKGVPWLLVAQRDHRIDLGGSPGGDERREQRDAGQDERDGDERESVGRFDSVKKA